MSGEEIDKRLALLEYQMDELKKYLEAHMEKEEAMEKEIMTSLQALELKVGKRAAYVTGAAAAVSAIWAVFLAFGAMFFKVKTGG
jgi:frataxin-like iron-binding protein CyaY